MCSTSPAQTVRLILPLILDIMVTIGFVPESYTVLEGAGGVSLGVEVRGGEIPAGQTVEVTLSTADDTANGVLHLEFRVNQSLNVCTYI